MPDSERILIVDDDARLCRTLERYLAQEGYQVRSATSAREMRRHLAVEGADLVILDLVLPDADGFALGRELQAEEGLALVILSGKGDTVDKVVGLEIGADDYITKPFDERELLARVRSVLRRTAAAAHSRGEGPASIVFFADWRLDLGSYELTAPNGDPVSLTPHEFQLLSAFVQHGNRVLTREMILERVSDRDWSPDDRSVDVLVGKLRKKIEQDPQEPRLIETVRGVGYKLKAKVSFQ